MNIELLAGNPYVTLTSFFLTILGLMISVISIFHKEKRELSYAVRSNQVLKNVSSGGFLAQYLGHNIKTLTITHIAIWNSGSKTLRDDDIIDSCPITLSLNGESIFLDATIVEKLI